MEKLTKLFYVAFIFLLFACGASLGDRVDSKNLSVYYMEGVTKKEAVDFATYWRDERFVSKDKQTIQLIKDEYGVVQVKLIEKKDFNERSLTVNEAAMLTKLARDLEKKVFHETRVKVLVCDNTFRPLIKD